VEAADGLLVPNGVVVTGDGRHLIIAESFAHRLTLFDIGPGGALSGRRLWADLGEHIPDGICLDAGGGIWFASVLDHAVLRVVEGGVLTHRVTTGEAQAYACMLGGSERTTLYVCTALADDPAGAMASRSGAIAVFDGPLPAAGAGLP
jgi:sugar lactone lactonase YvrE